MWNTVARKNYFDKLKRLKDKRVIKVVTGVRRCGKSTLLLQFKEYLTQSGVAPEQIITLNFEDIHNHHLLDYKVLHAYIEERLVQDKPTYVLLDEIQLVPEFEKTINSLLLRDPIDIYVTGSNAYMLSGELATLLSGRYIEINMLPLSFAEYYQVIGGSAEEAWKKYLRCGGFPYTTELESEDLRNEYLLGVYSMVLLKDIVARKKITDVPLLESVIKFLFSNIGSMVSSKKIANTLTSNGRNTSPITVENYISALMNSFFFYKATRYDIKGKQYLKSLEKYYLVDMGLRTMLVGAQNPDIGHVLENIVYLELLRRGYSVYIGKVDNLEVDFVAQRGGETVYYQVAATLYDQSTFQREVAPLQKIKDNYPKCIISLDTFPTGIDGINQIYILDFLLGEGRIEQSTHWGGQF